MDKEIVKLFLKFLESNNALEKYIYNVEQYGSNGKHILANDNREILTFSDNLNSITQAFTWCWTPEGRDFWSKIDAKWKIYYTINNLE